MLEKQVEQHLSKRVKTLGGLSLKWTSTITGVPDRIVFLCNRIHLVELKTSDGVLSARQKIVFAQLEAQGFPVTVLRSKEDVDVFTDGVSSQVLGHKARAPDALPGKSKSTS
jgi:hypothetical protein